MAPKTLFALPQVVDSLRRIGMDEEFVQAHAAKAMTERRVGGRDGSTLRQAQRRIGTAERQACAIEKGRLRDKT